MLKLIIGSVLSNQEVVVLDESKTIREVFNENGAGDQIASNVTITAGGKKVTANAVISALGLSDGDMIIAAQNLKSAN